MGLGRSRSWLLALIAVIPLPLFALFVATAFYLHGDAFTGKLVSGHYFVGNHGKYTEVSEGAFLFSLWLGRVTVASFVAAGVLSPGGLALHWATSAWRWITRKAEAESH